MTTMREVVVEMCARADNEALQRMRADFMSGSVSGLDIMDLIATARIIERESIAAMLDRMAQAEDAALATAKRDGNITTASKHAWRHTAHVDAAAAVRARGQPPAVECIHDFTGSGMRHPASGLEGRCNKCGMIRRTTDFGKIISERMP